MRWGQRGLWMVLLLSAPSAYGAPSFDQLMVEARVALRHRDFVGAQGLCSQALSVSEEPPEGGPRSVKAATLCAEVASQRGDEGEAARRWAQAAHLSVHDHDQRRRFLIARKKAAQSAQADRQVALIEALLDSDSEVQSALRKPKRGGEGLNQTLKQLRAAVQVYQRDKDRAFEALAQAIMALVLAHSAQEQNALEVARDLAGPQNPKAVRLVALEALYVAATKKEEVRVAADAAIRLNGLHHADLPEARRRYARRPELEKACVRLDALEGPGACTRREIDLVGFGTFTDFSRGKKKRELTEGDLARVHVQGLAALESCVLTEARKNPEQYRETDLRFTWVIDAEGRATQMEIAPKRYAEALRACQETVIAWLRYPRSDNREGKVVTVPFRLD